LIFTVYKNASGISRLQKPDKIFLENTNLMYTLSGNLIEEGNIRETFFTNQLKYQHLIEVSDQSDFLIEKKFTFEIGGKNKKQNQIRDISDSYIAADNIEYGFDNKIPLWLFGFLY
jgi:uncharacterized protein